MTIKGRKPGVFFVLVLGNIVPLAVIAADNENIFDIPQESGRTPPKYAAPGENKGSRDKNFGKDDGIPNFMQIKNIPSLTQEQRRQIHNIYDQAKPDMNIMMKDMQSQNQVEMNQDTRARRRELREKLKAKRQETWGQVKAVLNDRNLQDLELMKKGQLLPPDLRQSGAPPAEALGGVQ